MECENCGKDFITWEVFNEGTNGKSGSCKNCITDFGDSSCHFCKSNVKEKKICIVGNLPSCLACRSVIKCVCSKYDIKHFSENAANFEMIPKAYETPLWLPDEIWKEIEDRIALPMIHVVCERVDGLEFSGYASDPDGMTSYNSVFYEITLPTTLSLQKIRRNLSEAKAHAHFTAVGSKYPQVMIWASPEENPTIKEQFEVLMREKKTSYESLPLYKTLSGVSKRSGLAKYGAYLDTDGSIVSTKYGIVTTNPINYDEYDDSSDSGDDSDDSDDHHTGDYYDQPPHARPSLRFCLTESDYSEDTVGFFTSGPIYNVYSYNNDDVDYKPTEPSWSGGDESEDSEDSEWSGYSDDPERMTDYRVIDLSSFMNMV